MIHKIMYSEKTSYNWRKNKGREANRVMLDDMIYNLIGRLKCYGYLYLNQIYEHLGIKWADLRSNDVICCYDSLDGIFSVKDSEDGGFVIEVNYNFY